MKSIDEVIDKIFANARDAGEIRGAPRYNKFGYIRETGGAVILMRENGNQTKVPRKVLARAIEAVRLDHSIHGKGPGALRKASGITHVTSPTWALLRGVPLSCLTE